jgi:N-acetylmuramoyl-L-alanine amidase
MQLLRVALLALAIAWVVPARAVEVRAVRLWASPEGTQVILELSGSAKHSLLLLKNPDRVVLDVADARLSAGARRPPASGAVKEVRMARRPNGELRVVLDLTRPMRAPRPAISSSPSTPDTAARIRAPSACTARARRT